MDPVAILEDEIMAMDFAFRTLARALHRQGVLPIPVLGEQIGAVAEQLSQPDGQGNVLSGVARRLLELRVSLEQLQ